MVGSPNIHQRSDADQFVVADVVDTYPRGIGASVCTAVDVFGKRHSRLRNGRSYVNCLMICIEDSNSCKILDLASVHFIDF